MKYLGSRSDAGAAAPDLVTARALLALIGSLGFGVAGVSPTWPDRRHHVADFPA
jgi:hypothetical protein